MSTTEKLTLAVLKEVWKPEEDRYGETTTHKSHPCDACQSIISVLAKLYGC